MANDQGWTDWFPVITDNVYTPKPECSYLKPAFARIVAQCKHSELRDAIRHALRPFVKVSVKR